METNFKLENHKLFSGLSSDQLSHIEKMLHVRKYEPDEVICQEGGISNQVYIISEGEVNVSKQKEESEDSYDIARLSVGQIIGEMSLINRTPYSATVTAAVPVTLLILSHDDFSALKNDNNNQIIYYKIIENIASELCKRITRNNQILIDLMHSKKSEELLRNAKMSFFAGFWSM